MEEEGRAAAAARARPLNAAGVAWPPLPRRRRRRPIMPPQRWGPFGPVWAPRTSARRRWPKRSTAPDSRSSQARGRGGRGSRGGRARRAGARGRVRPAGAAGGAQRAVRRPSGWQGQGLRPGLGGRRGLRLRGDAARPCAVIRCH
jgi:hypothetical protein